MGLILTEPGFRAAGRSLTRQPAINRPPSFNKFRMSGGVAGQSTASPPPTGQQSAANPAVNRPPSFNKFRMSGMVASPQPIPVEPATGGEGGV